MDKRIFDPEELEVIKKENFEVILVSIFRQHKSCFFQKQNRHLGRDSKHKKKASFRTVNMLLKRKFSNWTK